MKWSTGSDMLQLIGASAQESIATREWPSDELELAFKLLNAQIGGLL
jgi:hypothetical protein